MNNPTAINQSPELVKKTITSAQLIACVTLYILCFVSSSVVSAQNKHNDFNQKIRGVVTDDASGQPLPYVTIHLEGFSGTGAVSDNDGRFELSGVPLGRHTLIASFMGYETVVYREILVTSSKEVYLELLLKERSLELEEVVVRPKINKELPLNRMATTGARMLSVEDARRYAGGMDDPARLVGSFAGVSPGVSNNGISIHGNAPHLLQWKLEDIEIPNPNHFADISTLGGGVLSSLSTHVLGNSDFFTGAFPAEYTNALSGVFDMKLRSGNNRKYEHTFQAGILGLDFASEGPISKKNNSSYIFNYRYSTTGLLSKLSLGSDLGGVLDYQDLNFKLNFPTVKAGVFSVWGTALIDKYADDFENESSKWEFNSDRIQSEAKQYMMAGGITHRYLLNNNAVLKTTLAGTYYRQKAYEHSYNTSLVASPYLNLYTEDTDLTLNTSYNRKITSAFTNKTGFTYTRKLYDMNLNLAPFETEPLEKISGGDGATDLITVYNTSAWKTSEQVSVHVGLNGQLLTLNNSWTVEPRAGVKWQPTEKST